MYQYSLQAVTRLFKMALQNAEDAGDDAQKRLENLIDKITQTMYENVCRGLFEAHKLIFSFLISTSINKDAEVLDPNQFSVLLTGAGMIDKNAIPPNPDKDRIQNSSWELAFYLESTFENFKGKF